MTYGASAAAYFAEIEALQRELAAARDGDLLASGTHLAAAGKALCQATSWVATGQEREPAAAAAAANPYLRLFGIVTGGFLMAKAALAARRTIDAGEGDPGFCETKITTARFYADHFLCAAPALVHPVTSGAASVLRLAEDRF